ncbi:hypothetical protein DM02DRAFT_205193 [Periconia macrospinosa]|uniref:UBA domain-containing protein n=1 Tax=Periconia macrospinosa TaxID=97972 RepID=A0A2V1D7Q2_9PLEO|nr:hypothetical protein DM02DRAFT_205193 [Periconia macrospinosa]
MSFAKSRATKQPGPVLRVVPKTQTLPIFEATPGSGRLLPATPATAPIAAPTSAPTSAPYNPPLTRFRSNSASTPASGTREENPRSASSASFRPPIENERRYLPQSVPRYREDVVPISSSSAPRIPRLGLKVDTTGQVDPKPLPQLPFFKENNGGNRPVCAPGGPNGDSEYNVSPPSASMGWKRNSMVSPLSNQEYSRYQPMQGFSPIAELDTQAFTSCPDLSTGPSSAADYRDDTSSIYSADECSVKSYEAYATQVQAQQRTPERSHRRNRSISLPETLQEAVSRDGMKSEGSETGHRVLGLAYPEQATRDYAHHPPLENHRKFIPTCAHLPERAVLDPTRRIPTIQFSDSSNSPPASCRLDREMGIITEAIHRQTPQNHLPLEIPSPTWSEAENDLEQHLSFSAADDDPFKWDDIVNFDDIAPLDDIIPVEDIRISRDAPLSPQGLGRKDSITYSMAFYSPPKPRRNTNDSQGLRQRSNTAGSDGFRLSNVPYNHIASQMKRRNKSKNLNNLNIAIIEEKDKRMTTDDFILSPLPIPLDEWKVAHDITPEVAEGVVLQILKSLDNLDDLFACAVINRGFYRVFKRNELELMKLALRKMSPPAWEHREICYPGHDEIDEEALDLPRQDYTAESYLRAFTRDMYIISATKALIKDKCQSFLRPEISAAIDSEDPVESARVDDALWRIWTFCKIFGSRKGREDDVTSQMDWLQGGKLVHQQTCSSSAALWDNMNEVLASAPECFAKGNEGGLKAEQLFDIMELWNCLGVLLQKIEGRTVQAREYGIFDRTDIRGGDIDGEEMMLDEWYYWLLTQGLSTVLELSGPCQQSDSSVFIVASRQGLANWTPPAPGGTRRNFLKEAASRVYEDEIAHVYAESSTKEVNRVLSKQRIQRHINEIRSRRTSDEPVADIRVSMEGSMNGEWEEPDVSLSRPRSHHRKSVNNLVTHIPSLSSVRQINTTSNLAQEIAVSLSRTPSPHAPSPYAPSPMSPPQRMVAMPLLPSPPPSTAPSNRDSMPMPSLQDHPAFRQPTPSYDMPTVNEQQHSAYYHQRRPSFGSSIASSAAGSSESRAAFQQHPLQRSMHDNDAAENTVERAIHRIVEMGFTPEQARQALRMTDLGDGLRVDRAVELLLRDMSM